MLKELLKVDNDTKSLDSIAGTEYWSNITTACVVAEKDGIVRTVGLLALQVKESVLISSR